MLEKILKLDSSEASKDKYFLFDGDLSNFLRAKKFFLLISLKLVLVS